MSKSHAIERTSEYGTPFVGRCIWCGATGLKMADAMKPCPKYPAGVSQDDALVRAIEGGNGDDPANS